MDSAVASSNNIQTHNEQSKLSLPPNPTVPFSPTLPFSPILPPRPSLELPYLALDSSKTRHHENAIRISEIDGGFRAELAVVDPSQIPELVEFRRSGSTSRENWQQLINSLNHVDSPYSVAGLQQDTPTLALVVSVDFPNGSVTPGNISIQTDQIITTRYLGFDSLGEALRCKKLGIEYDSQHFLTAKAAMAFFCHRRSRGDVVFADVNTGLVLQPDGSWEKYCPQDLLGRIAVQEITTAVLAALSEHASVQSIPLLYRGCSAIEPELICRLSSHLKDSETVNRGVIDDLLIDQFGHRRRLLGRAICSASPIPHVAIGGKAYSRVTAPFRVFQDYVNVSQLYAWAKSEPPPYCTEQLNLMAQEVNNNSGRRIRRKGANKYPAVIAHDLDLISLNPDSTPKLIRSLIASCRDAGDYPFAAIKSLIKVVRLDPHIGIPIMSDLCFSREFEKHPLLARELRSFIDRNPTLVDALIAYGVENHFLKKFQNISISADSSEVIDSLWFAGHKVSFIRSTKDLNPGLSDFSKFALLDREHFRKFMGLRHIQEDLTDFPIATNLFKLHQHSLQTSPATRIHFSCKRPYDQQISVYLALLDEENNCLIENYSEDPGVADNWLQASESAAVKLLSLLDQH